MKRLGLDMDGVLYNWHESVYDYYREFKGYGGTLHQFWNEKSNTISDEEFEFITQIDFLYSNSSPDDDCKNFIKNVSENFELFYITARPPLVKLTTEQYLRRHKFPFMDNLIFNNDKANVARLLRLDYFIEDRKEIVIELSKVVFTIMRARPWNKEIWYEYPTVHSLMESLQYLED